MTPSAYPVSPSARTRWVLDRRPRRNLVKVDRPHAFFLERESTRSGRIASVAAVFLTNRECPWKCVMCDLWWNTTGSPVPGGAIPTQIEFALSRLPKASALKLYNSGSFFDAGAIAKFDWPRIAELCRGFERVIVECHPRLVNEEVLRFQAMLEGSLEVAMGLETCHPEALEALNKRITLRDYARSAEFLNRHGIAIRSFLLVHPPFIPPAEQGHWLKESIRFAFDAGSGVVSLIPTRGGNGALDQLEALGLFHEPTLEEFESAQELGLRVGSGRVFADTWDLRRFASCRHCFRARLNRIERINLAQRAEPRVTCQECERSRRAV